MPIMGLKPTSCDDIGVALRTLKTRVCVSMDIRVDLAKETARPRLFFVGEKMTPRAVERRRSVTLNSNFPHLAFPLQLP